MRTLHQSPSGKTPNWARRAGSSSIEFAAVGSLFFLLIMGIFELGRGFMVQHLLTNAARQGCRVGILRGKSTADITAAVNAGLSTEGVRNDSVTVQVNDGAADASTANSGDEITVKVSVPVSQISWLPGTKYLSGSLASQYTLRRE